jgi:Bacteriophage tail sheath protein
MAAAIKTPGVYIHELNAFPNSVVEVPTAVPAFIGYTEKYPPNGLNVPKRLTSLNEYEKYFGGAPRTEFTFAAPQTFTLKKETRFLLYYSMRLFFDNGGGPCWIIPIGTYADATANGMKADSFTKKPIAALKKVLEPTMLVAPDAVLFGSVNDWQTVCQQFLQHCGEMQSRVSILDVYQGDQERNNDENTDVINVFRNKVTSDYINYGQAYYPWVNTSIVEEPDVDFSAITKDSLAAFGAAITNAIANDFKDAPNQDAAKNAQAAIAKLIAQMPAAKDAADAKAAAAAGTTPPAPSGTTPPTQPPATPAAGTATLSVAQIHGSLRAVSPGFYVDAMRNMQKQLNLLPPSGGMAGVYTRTDNTLGVFKAPANTGMSSVVTPAVDISHDDQADLNVPLDGKAVNAIRTFPGRGVLIWGARTLDGNSQDWRYINVRRTIIMLEQSIKYATLAYVFEANSASTWVTVKNMITNFLINQWKAGALVGAKPEEAFSVDVGLGSTMTADDILNGFMNVTVKVALVRPAEFIVITFQQKMQTS